MQCYVVLFKKKTQCKVNEYDEVDVKEYEDSQHEVLFPAWLAATHRNGGALHILHLQGDVGVEFLCRKSTTKHRHTVRGAW